MTCAKQEVYIPIISVLQLQNMLAASQALFPGRLAGTCTAVNSWGSRELIHCELPGASDLLHIEFL